MRLLPAASGWHDARMRGEELAQAALAEAHRTFVDNVEGITLEEALHAAGGYRSILGIAKHVAGWSAVYHSYAFESEPRHWDRTDWPWGLRDRIEPTKEYLDEIITWHKRTYERWLGSIQEADDLDSAVPVHWGTSVPLGDIVLMVSDHWIYHAGEINAILAIRRAEAWEYGEEVEENHISTVGHGVRPDWMSDEEAAQFEQG
jgi:hypothetical protein